MGHELDILKAFVMNGESYEVDIIWEGPRPLFKANDISVILNMVNVRSTLQNYDGDEKVVRAIDSRQETDFPDGAWIVPPEGL